MYDARSFVNCNIGTFPNYNLSIKDIRRLAWGKTHFLDADATRFFGSRYSRIRQDGSLVTLIESARVGWKGARRFRVVTFDVMTGNVETLSTYERTPERAIKARRDFDLLVSFRVESDVIFAAEKERCGP